MNELDIRPYIEPIYRYCRRHVADPHDAEDLASEILCHALEGMRRYHITSLRAWIWRIARNRYARYIDGKNRRREITLTGDPAEMEEEWCLVDEAAVTREYEDVFRCLHTLASDCRNLFVDYYLGGMSVRALAAKYAVPETTVKWRLNTGREKIRKRIGDNTMDKIYRRINWNTTTCNGACDPDAYLHTQLARAICAAAYEHPLTVEELSLATGIPTLYIEDALPHLEYGEAIRKTGSRYAADFIVLRLADRAKLESAFTPHIETAASVLAAAMEAAAGQMEAIGFYGCDFGMERLGHIAVPFLLRERIGHIKNDVLGLRDGPYPPRKDGGYGWFIVEETDASEGCHPTDAGCNIAGDDSGSAHPDGGLMYYYWIGKYFDAGIYHGRGIRWLCAQGIPQRCRDGILPAEMLDNEDLARLIAGNLVARTADGLRLNFPCFTPEQFAAFTAAIRPENDALDAVTTELVTTIRREFGHFVPKRLEGQINQWVSCYAHSLVGYVTEVLIGRGVLRRPGNMPFTDGVCFVG